MKKSDPLRYWPIIAVLIGLYVLNSGWAAIFLYHAGIVLTAILTKASWKSITRGMRWIPAIGLWIMGVAAAPAVVVLLPILLGMSADEVGAALASGLSRAGMDGAQFWLFVIYLCLPHPPIEEMGWREVLYVDSPKLSFRDFEFASYHLLVMHYFFPYKWFFFLAILVSLAVVGWIWRRLKMHFHGLAVPTFFHAGGDLGAMLGVWWLIRGHI